MLCVRKKKITFYKVEKYWVFQPVALSEDPQHFVEVSGGVISFWCGIFKQNLRLEILRMDSRISFCLHDLSYAT